MPLFSVIVPVYNVGEHFYRGLRCLESQTSDNFEVILVDDGSTDGSGRLCDEAAAADERIRVIHQRNAGAGGARNAGIDAARGEYVCFFDIDDRVAAGWLEALERHVAASHPQLLVSGYRETDTRLHTEHVYRFAAAEYRTADELKAAYVHNLSGIRFNNGFVWNKVYERDFLIRNGIRFPDLKIQQDEVFNLAVYLHAGRVSVTDDVLYDYFVYYDGNTRSNNIPERFDIFCKVKEAFLTFCEEWGLKDADFENYIHRRFVCSLFYNTNREPSVRRAAWLHKMFDSPSVAASVGVLRHCGTGGGIFFRLRLRALERRSVLLYEAAAAAENIASAAWRAVKGVTRALKI